MPCTCSWKAQVGACVGRVSTEKNLDAFLSLDLPGTKVIVGDGPQRRHYARRYPDAVFLGWRTGDDLASAYSAADVMVFPSRFETFGLVVLEALACGTPVAAFPVHGPIDILGGTDVGVLSQDLRAAALAALAIPRTRCRSFAEAFSWRRSAEAFLSHLAPIRHPAAAGDPLPTPAGRAGVPAGDRPAARGHDGSDREGSDPSADPVRPSAAP